MKIKLTENKLKQIVNESVKKVLKEGRVKKIPKSINIDGVDYEKTDVKGGGMLHPGFRWKDHETHNPEKSKQFRKRKDGYRYVQSYDGSPRWIHNHLTNESSYDSNGNFDEVGYKNDINEARRPSDKTVGKHTLKGLRYDKNGNPLYTSDTMSDDEKKNQGWKFSKKHGMYGQLSDPTKLSENSRDINEAISTDYRISLKQILTKSFGNLNDNEKQFLYDLLNNEPWETIYTALIILESK